MRMHTVIARLAPTLLAAATLGAAPAGDLRASRGLPERISVFDARYLRQPGPQDPSHAAGIWDTMHTLAAIQGLANREAPRLYVICCDGFGVETDQYWLDWLRGEDGWLKGAELAPLTTPEEVVRTFRDYVKGLVVYDADVPATSCLASTAAGCDDLLPVRFSRETNSMFALLTGKLGLPVRLWLVNPDGTSKFTGKGLIPDLGEPSSGSAKCDAYRWAIRQFIDSGKCDPRTIRLATGGLPHRGRKGSAQVLRGLLRRRLRLAVMALQSGGGFLLRPEAGPGAAGLGLRPEPRRPGAAGTGLCLPPRDDQRLLYRGRLRRRLPESAGADGPSRFQAAARRWSAGRSIAHARSSAGT